MRQGDTWAFLNEEGKKLWGDVFPDGSVPVRSMLTEQAKLEGAGTERVFLIDWAALTAEQQNAILEKLSKKFNAPKEAILDQVRKVGLPLREKYTSGSGTRRMELFI